MSSKSSTEGERKGTHRDLLDANFGVVALGLELELDVQTEDLGVLE